MPELTEFLNELPVHSLGRKFLIIIRNSLVDNFLRVVYFFIVVFICILSALFLAEASENAPVGI